MGQGDEGDGEDWAAYLSEMTVQDFVFCVGWFMMAIGLVLMTAAAFVMK